MTTITGAINETAMTLLDGAPDGIRWKDLNRKLEQINPDWHPKTINGCVWLLAERFPGRVYKPEKGLFRSKKFEKESSHDT